MSLETWKAEFVPELPEDATTAEQLDWCITKYIGCRANNLTKHGVSQSGQAIKGSSGKAGYWIDASTCPLCATSEWTCRDCPLYLVRGTRCDRPDDMLSPYHEFVEARDPEPMIQLLRKAKTLLPTQ